jgi:hypothetical protein
MKKKYRPLLGFVSMVLGLFLLVSAAELNASETLSGTSKTVGVTATALGGGFLTFFVSRRLLTTRDE